MSQSPRGPFRMLGNRSALVRNAGLRIKTLGRAAPISAPAAPAPPAAPPPAPGTPITINLGSPTSAHAGLQILVRDAEDLRRRATLADGRAIFEKLYTEQRGLVDRLAALSATVVCPVEDLGVALDGIEQQWFAPDVSQAVYQKIDGTSAALTTEATAIADQINADQATLADPSQPAVAVLGERIKGLRQRIDDAVDEVRKMFTDLQSAHGQIRRRIEGLERTAKAVESSGLDAALLPACVAFARKVKVADRGDAYVTLAGQRLILQPVKTSGILLWKSDQVGPPEVVEVTVGVTLTDVQRPFLGDHGVTLRQEPPQPSFQLKLGKDALDDLIDAAS